MWGQALLFCGLARSGSRARRLVLLLRFMMADCAARGRARDAVVPGDMSGDAAHDRAFCTPFSVSRGMSEREHCGEREGSECVSGSLEFGAPFLATMTICGSRQGAKEGPGPIAFCGARHAASHRPGPGMH